MANGANFSMRWEGDLTEQRVQQLEPTIKRAMVAAANRIAPQAEGWMRSNAPWVDRTGNARNGLRASTQVDSKSVTIVLYHSVPYGIWLEVRWSGRYAIVTPAVEMWAPKYVDLVSRMVFS